ncbi:hypothetical protein CHS0354_040618 [Potamilus streckersoni]|uniref:Cell division control protein n=1 Tax=Potamilus streckersoni TaxID=2493646 RepID=A0AAE0VWK2_9BIVA|nr:hypothetical protein CHS0354_040618 [Potamilus streckersoni]
MAESMASVQRKLEFPVRKSKKSICSKQKTENINFVQPQPSVKPVFTSPRKRGVEGNEENLVIPILCTPSPSKRRSNGSTLIPSKREETPACCGSLMQKFYNTANSPSQKVSTSLKSLVLSPTKSNSNECMKENSSLKSPKIVRFYKPDGNGYHKAKQSFHTSKPERLVGREKEVEEINAFLKGHMLNKTAGSLYISGAPGTGKTASLMHLLDQLQDQYSCKTLYLNCMTLKDSSTVFGKLYMDLTGKNAPTSKERQRAVEKCLTSAGPSVVMVLDEIDQLDSKNQEILYTIFEWPSLSRSRLILIGIANALDLTDRVLPRLQARPKCRPQLLNFAPYSKEQITAILKARLEKLEEEGVVVMEPSAVMFCARKISAVAGDARKALDVCRRAIELVESDVRSQQVLKLSATDCNSPIKNSGLHVPKKITVQHISKVLSDVYGSSSAAQEQETVPLQQKLVVCSLLLLVKEGKFKEVTVGKLHEVYRSVCQRQQIDSIDFSELQGITTLLEARGIFGIKKAKEARMSKVTLKLDEKELEHTLQDKVLMSTILKQGLTK